MRKSLWLIVLLTMLALVIPAQAQEGTMNNVSFNNFSFSYDPALGSRVTIVQQPGDAPQLEQPGGPIAPHTYFTIYDELADPAFPEFGPIIIRVYRTADLAAYPLLQPELANLQNLVSNQPDLSAYTNVPDDMATAQSLPFLYGIGASQVIRGQARYVNLGAIKGVSYLTVFRHDVSPFTSGEFIYTFQGVTDDGQYAVSAQFAVSTDLIPAQIPDDFDYAAFEAGYTQYLRDSTATLNSATPDRFTPSLNTLDAVLESFSFGAVTGEVPGTAPEATTQPESTPPVVSDPSFGGLGGVTWTLVSYGDPEAPTPAVPEAPATISFGVEGVTGDTGCNSFGGPFTYDNDTLTVGALVATRVACSDVIMTQETDLLTALESVSGFDVTDGTLQIFYENGTRVLTFAASAP